MPLGPGTPLCSMRYFLQQAGGPPQAATVAGPASRGGDSRGGEIGGSARVGPGSTSDVEFSVIVNVFNHESTIANVVRCHPDRCKREFHTDHRSQTRYVCGTQSQHTVTAHSHSIQSQHTVTAHSHRLDLHAAFHRASPLFITSIPRIWRSACCNPARAKVPPCR